MLFLEESILGRRDQLIDDMDAGKITSQEGFEKILELDPDGHIALTALAIMRFETGDSAGAEERLWRAIEKHPYASRPYIELARILQARPETKALAKALAELGASKHAREDESILDAIDFNRAGISGKDIADFKKLTLREKAKMFALWLRAENGPEPAEVSARLHQLRLIEEMLQNPDLSSETVDEILSAGPTIKHLLLGLLRGWAQEALPEEDDSVIENALALLGEIGEPADIPYFLEFTGMENRDIAEPAAWGLERVIRRSPAASAEVIRTIAGSLGPLPRMTLAEMIVRCRELDPGGSLFECLTGKLETWKPSACDEFFPVVLTAILSSTGSAKSQPARAMLKRHRELLSKKGVRKCENLISTLEDLSLPPANFPASPITVYDICAGEAEWEDGEDDEDEDEADDFMIPEPIHRTAKPGRNDPCWCNSGKKYKKCHLEADERGTQLQGGNEFVSLRSRIGEYFGELTTKKEVRLAMQELLHQGSIDEADVEITVGDWFIHDWVSPSTGHSLLQDFMLREGKRLTPREREMAEAWSKSYYGLYEVQEPKPGIGVTLKDLIFGGTILVHDVSSSRHLVKWDALLARVVPGERGSELAGIGVTVPRHNIAALHEWMDDQRTEKGLEWRPYLKQNWPDIRRQSQQIAANWFQSMALSNTDGEKLLISKAVYRMEEKDSVLQALGSCPALKEDEKERLVWLDKKETVLGNIRLNGNELEFDCNSKERLERGKQLLEKVAKGLLHHLRDDFTTQAELKRQVAARTGSKPAAEDEIPKSVRDELIGKYMEQHYKEWPDLSLPALGGTTARQAVKTPAGRAQVMALLKDFENGEERKRRDGEPSYDINRVRAELGLT